MEEKSLGNVPIVEVAMGETKMITMGEHIVLVRGVSGGDRLSPLIDPPSRPARPGDDVAIHDVTTIRVKAQLPQPRPPDWGDWAAVTHVGEVQVRGDLASRLESFHTQPTNKIIGWNELNRFPDWSAVLETGSMCVLPLDATYPDVPTVGSPGEDPYSVEG